jgi:ubiquinone/menaquinone biosynthesis C-methylase UbiE
MVPDEKREVAARQRRYFNALVDVFDTPQPEDVMDRLQKIVAAAGLHQGEVILDVGTGVGVLIPLIESYHPSLVLACDVAEKMLERVRKKYPQARSFQADIALSPLQAGCVDAIFMNAMYGNIADKAAACREAARMLRPGGRLVVSHPEGRRFVDDLRATTDLFIESLPDKNSFAALVGPLGLRITAYRDDPRLYLIIAEKEPRR